MDLLLDDLCDLLEVGRDGLHLLPCREEGEHDGAEELLQDIVLRQDQLDVAEHKILFPLYYVILRAKKEYISKQLDRVYARLAKFDKKEKCHDK